MLSTDKSKGETGAVSVYFIIVLVPIFAFMSVLVDFARIGAADRESELAVKAGLRSVMSAFDSQLHKYGLFALTMSEEKRAELFRKTLLANGADVQNSTLFRFVDTSVTEGSELLQPIVTLAFPDVFRRQLLEEMKYRAPLEFMLEVSDKLKQTGVSSQLADGKTFSENADKLEELLDKREYALDAAWTKFRQLHNELNHNYNSNRIRLQELNLLATQIASNVADNVNGSSGGDTNPIHSLLLRYAELIAETQLVAKLSAAAVTDLQAGLNEVLNTAKLANDELRIEWKRVNASASSGWPTAQYGAVQVLSDEYFTELQADIGTITALFGAFASEVAATFHYTDQQTLSLNAKNDTYREKANAAFASREPAERQRQKRNEAVRAKKRQLWRSIGDILDQAKQAIGGCQLSASGDRDRQSYEQLSANAAKYSVEASQNTGEAVIELNDPKKIGSSALQLGGMISSVLEGARDTVFMNEYGLTHFNYRTFGMERVSNQIKPITTLTQPHSHTLAGQEAEYFTYGFSSCAANVGAAYGEMFAIRLAVRTLERLTQPQNQLLQLGSPLLVLLAATAEGAVDALQDMNKLTSGEEVPLFAKIAPAISLSYKDYLRLLLLIHGSSDSKLSRLQALIELNTGIDLTAAFTQLRAEASTSVKLLFMSGGIKLLGMTGMSPCNVLAGRCQLNRSADLSY